MPAITRLGGDFEYRTDPRRSPRWWQWLGPDTDEHDVDSRHVGEIMPDEGWKLHIGATAQTAQEIYNRVAPRLFELGMPHKVLENTETLERPSGDQTGKWFVVYPWSLAHGIRAVCAIDQVMGGGSHEPRHQELTVTIAGDQPVGRTVVYARYGQFGSGDYILGPNRGPAIYDDRSRPCPNHVTNLWPVCQGLMGGAPPRIDRLPLMLREQFPVYTSVERAAFDRLNRGR